MYSWRIDILFGLVANSSNQRSFSSENRSQMLSFTTNIYPRMQMSLQKEEVSVREPQWAITSKLLPSMPSVLWLEDGTQRPNISTRNILARHPCAPNEHGPIVLVLLPIGCVSLALQIILQKQVKKKIATSPFCSIEKPIMLVCFQLLFRVLPLIDPSQPILPIDRGGKGLSFQPSLMVIGLVLAEISHGQDQANWLDLPVFGLLKCTI